MRKHFAGYSDFSPNLFRKILFRFCLHTSFLFPLDEVSIFFLVQTLNGTGCSLCKGVCLRVGLLMWFSKTCISWDTWGKYVNSSNKSYFPIREEILVRFKFYSKSYKSSHSPFTELLNRTALEFMWYCLGLLGSCWALPLSWRALLPRAGCVAFCNNPVPREKGAKCT